MIPTGLDMPPFTVTAEKHAVRVSGLSQNDRYSLLGPNGISLVSQDQDSPTTYRIPGVTEVDVSEGVPKDTVLLRFRSQGFGEAFGNGDTLAKRADEWLAWHFAELREAQLISLRALHASRERRIQS